MNNRIREAFGQIHAEQALKDRTRDRLAQMQSSPRSRKTGYLRLIPILTCLVLVLLGGWGGYQVYFTPASFISIDINPSLELGVNRFDKVVSVVGYNPDGEVLAGSLDVKYMDYAEAVSSILDSDALAAYAGEDAVVSIAVLGQDGAQRSEMLAQVESCAAGYRNAYCYADNLEVAEAAHASGLSCGKYHAYLELHALDPTVTPDEVRELSIRDIRDRIAALSGGNVTSQAQDTNADSGHHGEGHGGEGYRHRNQKQHD